MGQTTDGNLANAHCVLDASGYTHTLRIRNTAFPQQQWLHECTSLLGYACIAWLFVCVVPSSFILCKKCGKYGCIFISAPK